MPRARKFYDYTAYDQNPPYSNPRCPVYRRFSERRSITCVGIDFDFSLSPRNDHGVGKRCDFKNISQILFCNRLFSASFTRNIFPEKAHRPTGTEWAQPMAHLRYPLEGIIRRLGLVKSRVIYFNINCRFRARNDGLLRKFRISGRDVYGES